MIPAQNKIDSMSAQDILDVSRNEVYEIERQRRDEIGRGFR